MTLLASKATQWLNGDAQGWIVAIMAVGVVIGVGILYKKFFGAKKRR